MFDVGVIGGGMVGSSVALGLAQQGCKVALVESTMPESYVITQPPDLRVSAINLLSQNLLSQLGAWQSIEKMRLCPFKRMSVWENAKHRTDFVAKDMDLENLGHIVENRLVQLALLELIGQQENVTLLSNGIVDGIHINSHINVTVKNTDSFNCKLLIGADGGNSQVRKLMNIGSQGWQYTQQALGIQIKMTDGVQRDITWQAFRPTGPLAFLPLYGGYGSLVWYDDANTIRYLNGLNKTQLKAQILEHFPSELVDFEILNYASFPLTRMHANHYAKGNTVLVGDAAHTINPLAGQGVNLGFKDVQVLLEKMSTWDKQENSIKPILVQYESIRRPDNLLMMSAMDFTYSLFSNDIGPLKLLRNVGLALADKATPLKKQVMKYALGLN
ncbi:FAD-dependent monooxygenase [Aliiglaciecola sp. LCG003]|nr:FAD-dependent oxidoreductase [Aliiglaciecola sp. LCG003]WJG11303.1 FAD-dependent monooxygenase [Aliiglaciecola sp. LCG003]